MNKSLDNEMLNEFRGKLNSYTENSIETITKQNYLKDFEHHLRINGNNEEEINKIITNHPFYKDLTNSS